MFAHWMSSCGFRDFIKKTNPESVFQYVDAVSKLQANILGEIFSY